MTDFLAFCLALFVGLTVGCGGCIIAQAVTARRRKARRRAQFLAQMDRAKVAQERGFDPAKLQRLPTDYNTTTNREAA